MIEAKKIKKIKALTSKNLLSEGETRIKPKALTQAVLSNIKFTENPLKGKKNLTQSFDVWEIEKTSSSFSVKLEEEIFKHYKLSEN